MTTEMRIDPSRSVDPDHLADLEAERSFLLHSLSDLDAEWAAGDVDEHDYVTLRDGYTKRAADVLRQIDEGRARLPAKQPATWSRRLAVVAAVVTVAAVAGWLVARSSGQRLPGQEISGDAAGDDVAATLTQARLLLGTDPLRAVELYSQVIERRPGHAEAHTYRGWLLYVGSGEAGDDARAQAVAIARDDLADAIESDPQYADPHCFLAVIAANDADTATAEDEADQCLALDPPGEVRALMDQFLAGLSDTSTPD